STRRIAVPINTCRRISANKNNSANRIKSFGGESIWSELQGIATKCNIVANLGQGFPDWNPEEFTINALKEQLNAPNAHQYARAHGDMQLVTSLSKLYSGDKFNGFDREIDPINEVMVVNGASDGLTVAMNALINPGDQVICIEPFFDCYDKIIESVEAEPIYVALKEPKNKDDRTAEQWTLDERDLRAAVTSKTKALILNTPHNPTGKIFSKTELEMIAKVAQEHDLLVISDEVYENLVFHDHLKHFRIANLPGMWDRTLTISSAGKTFSTTGWKMGWIIGPKHLIDPTYHYNMYKIFSVTTPIQKAVGLCIDHAMNSNYFSLIQNRLKQRKFLLQKMLKGAKLDYIDSNAGYFLLTDISNVKFPHADEDKHLPRDHAFCRWLPGATGLMAIPPSVFYSKDHKHYSDQYIRLAFCKKEETMVKAQEGFKKLSEFINK
ncbi:kynurenine-oxoglutarate transaminase, partial [Acrasis kona]